MADAPDSGSEKASHEHRAGLENRPPVDVRSDEIGDPGALVGHSSGPSFQSGNVADPVETALAVALTEASRAGRFDVVAQLAKELEARRLARAENVVSLASRRERR